MSKILFLTGIGRSGTTLLQQMLHAHSQIFFQPETHFFKHYILPYTIGKPIAKESLVKLMENDNYLKRLKEEEELELKKLDANLESLKEGFLKLLENNNTIYGADKDTEYVRYFPHLNTCFPDGVVVNIIRDPREVVLSRTKTPWGKSRSATFHAAEYVYYLKKMRKEGTALFGENYFEVKYEDLLENPKKEIEDLLKALGLPFEEGVMEYAKKSNGLIANDEKAWKGNADKPIMKGNNNKWEKELSKPVVGLLEEELKEEMKELGYLFSNNKSNLKVKLEYKAVYTAFALKTRKERVNG